MGLPLVADILPMRGRLVARTIGLGLELIGCCGCLVSCACGVRSKLIPGVLTGRAEMFCCRFRLVGYLLELGRQICVCHRNSFIAVRQAHRQPFLPLAASRRPKAIVGAGWPPGIV